MTENSKFSLQGDLLGVEQTEFRDKLSIDFLVLQQIQRCLISSTHVDPTIFEWNVLRLKSLLRSDSREQVDTYLELECIQREERWQYKYWCGVPMGSSREPHRNRYGEAVSSIRVEEKTDQILVPVA